MPIYEYRCASCGFQKEFLQKLSDPLHTVCPECGEESFKKMLTAAGFHLKGSGWYATDFKGGGTKPDTKSDNAKTGGGEKASGEKASAEKTGGEKSGGEKSGGEKSGGGAESKPAQSAAHSCT